ncbi:MAG: chorismate-binding protein [Deltaproteobacteria bacterium]|nr:chorismate-binding protein [Deltaproteobacteria bacterium]
MRAPAPVLARRLFVEATRQGLERALPFWADGGDAERHVLAAFPDRVVRLPVATDRATLAAALRELLPAAPSDDRAPLVVIGLSYDAGRALEAIGPGPEDDLGLPDLIVARYPGYLESFGDAGLWSERGPSSLRWLAHEVPPPPPAPRAAPPRFEDPRSRAAYVAGITEVIDRLRAGDLYQANIARRLECRAPPEATLDTYLALREVQPNRFGALWALDAATWIASNSPECLLHWDAASRTAKSFPIKGTRPRDPDRGADERARAALAASDKDRAEHLMIVDLVRNDLGRVARRGTVRVESLFEVMTLPTVHHLVSTVACEVDPAYDLVDVLLALFPGGSITGAPKIAAMRLIDRVEDERRGFYCGSLGVVLGGAEAAFSILIRTLLATRGRLVYATGGGIVVDSDPDDEWAETETKAIALQRALARTTNLIASVARDGASLTGSAPRDAANTTPGALMKTVIPILVVDAIEPSLSFWVDRLGFVVSAQVPHEDRLGFVILTRGEVVVELQARASVAEDVPLMAETGGVATIYIPVDEVAPIAAMLDGYEHVVIAERDTWYGMREIIVREPSGHFVFFGQSLPRPAAEPAEPPAAE